MATFFFSIFTLCFLATTTLTTLHNLHMFQLNAYKPAPHLAWLRRTLTTDYLPHHLLILIAALACLLPFPVALTLATLLLAAQAWLNRPHKAKKPLVPTPRIQRLIITIAILNLAILVAAWIARPHSLLLPILALVLSPLVMLIANTLNAPAENAVNRRYIADAKRILAAHPGLTVVGVTGSYGKTSVKHFLHRLLSAKYTTLMTPGNFNTTLGVVRTIRQELRPTHEIFVCEMGARNPGDIREICELVAPKHGVVTAIGPQHLESFKSLENVIKTKFELVDALPPDGIAFLNYDSEDIRHREVQGQKTTYALEPGPADYVARDVAVSSHGSSFTVRLADGADVAFETRLIGAHNVLNVTAAIAVADRLGVPADDLRVAVRRLESVPHRLQLINRGDLTIIDDAYNSNASGARAALQALAMFDGCKILVTPGMVELGAMEDRLNREFGRQAAGVCDCVILVGERQTASIREGLRDGGIADEKVHVVDTIEQAFAVVHAVPAADKRKIVLLENDLPDNY